MPARQFIRSCRCWHFPGRFLISSWAGGALVIDYADTDPLTVRYPGELSSVFLMHANGFG